MNKELKNEWLCRNCNSLIDGELKTCPCCHADRPEAMDAEEHHADIPEVVTRDNYANVAPIAKPKYTFREAVLVNAADIILALGMFCTFGALIAPAITDFGIENTQLWAICVAIALFAITMITWALLRTVADISRRLRQNSDR